MKESTATKLLVELRALRIETQNLIFTVNARAVLAGNAETAGAYPNLGICISDILSASPSPHAVATHARIGTVPQ